MSRLRLPPHRVDLDHHLGARIRARRHELGQSQVSLAARLGTSFQQVQHYERGVTRVSAALLFDIAAAQGVEVGYYYEGFTASAAAREGDAP